MTAEFWIQLAVSGAVGILIGWATATYARRQALRDEFEFRLVDMKGDVLLWLSSAEAPIVLRYGGVPAGDGWSDLDFMVDRRSAPTSMEAFLRLQGRLTHPA